MKVEAQEETEAEEAKLRTQILLQAPDLYKQMYGQEESPEIDQDEYLPESEEDVERMLKQLRRQGLAF